MDLWVKPSPLIHSFHALPTELMAHVLSYLVSSDLTAFYRACNRRLRRLLTLHGGIQSFQAYGPVANSMLQKRLGLSSAVCHVGFYLSPSEEESVILSKPHLVAPLSVIHFRKLKFLKIVGGDPFGLTATAIMALPPTLIDLELNFPQSILCFLRNRPDLDLKSSSYPQLAPILASFQKSDKLPWLPLHSVLPNLQSLIVIGNINDRVGLASLRRHTQLWESWLARIPPSVTLFSSDFISPTVPSLVEKLPPNLQTWIVPSTGISTVLPAPIAVAHMPRTLTSLEAPADSINDKADWKLLPSLLRNICLYSISPEEIELLPRELDSLKVAVRNRRQVQANHVLIAPLVDAEMLAQLPQTLTSLEISLGIPSPSIISRFPPLLTRLSLQGSFEAMNSSSIEAFPRTLVYLHFGFNIRLGPDDLRMLPPMLNALTMAPGEVYDTCLPVLPRSLSELSIFQVVVTGAYIQSIPRLTPEIASNSVLEFFSPNIMKGFSPRIVFELETIPEGICAVDKQLDLSRIVPISRLPRSLTSLNSDVKFTDDNIAQLPPALMSILTKSTFRISSLSSFPPNLRTIRGARVIASTDDWHSFCSTDPTHLLYPKTVFRYHLRRSSIQFSSPELVHSDLDSAVNGFPESLTSIQVPIKQEIAFTKLPSQLRSLYLGPNLLSFPHKGLELLPPTLTDLRILGVTSEDLDAVSLPLNLIVLRLDGANLKFGAPNWIVKLPRSLREFHSNGQVHFDLDHFSDLPPTLTLFQTETPLSWHFMRVLPKSITDLSVGILSPVDTEKVLHRLRRRREREYPPEEPLVGDYCLFGESETSFAAPSTQQPNLVLSTHDSPISNEPDNSKGLSTLPASLLVNMRAHCEAT